MEGDTGCPWEQPQDPTGWEMAGEGHWGNLSHLVPSPLVCWLQDAAVPRRVAAGPTAPGTKRTSRDPSVGRIACFWILLGARDVLPV